MLTTEEKCSRRSLSLSRPPRPSLRPLCLQSSIRKKNEKNEKKKTAVAAVAPGAVVLVHGESSKMSFLKAKLESSQGVPVHMPANGAEISIERAGGGGFASGGGGGGGQGRGGRRVEGERGGAGAGAASRRWRARGGRLLIDQPHNRRRRGRRGRNVVVAIPVKPNQVRPGGRRRGGRGGRGQGVVNLV